MRVKAEPLSELQKSFNKLLASARVVVEHVNSRVKKSFIFLVMNLETDLNTTTQ
ncbi:MAG: hypothetical protein LBC12_00620 [Nitrososphaerota archaeon]|nr:hypothetical protein [Nitrososphaerota archaeon]